MSRELVVRGFSTGRIRPKRSERGLRRWLPGGWSRSTLPVNVFVVDHPDGLVLFDAGLRARPGSAEYLPGHHPFLRLARFEVAPDEEAPAQLERLGVSPEDVRLIVLSHLHTDHVAGVACFPAAEVVVSPDEWRRAQGLGGRLRGYVPADLAGLSPRLLRFDRPAPRPFVRCDDVLGDGSLLAVATPGHTQGHVALLVAAAGGPVLLAGDVAHTPAELDAAAPELAAYSRAEGVRVLLTHDDGAPELAARR